MKTYSLNGDYILRYADEQAYPQGVEKMQAVRAVVPGNVEIDLMRAGILPDIYFGNNMKLLKPYEFYRWRYERTFNALEIKDGERVYLHFEGVDCFAEYYLNGEIIGYSENALIDHRFEVTELIKSGENYLAVEIKSPMIHAAELKNDAYTSAMNINYESLRVRKSPAAYGWDIMPRMLSAGLWRDVNLEIEGENEITELYFATVSLSENSARVTCAFETKCAAKYMQGMKLRVTASLDGEAKFTHEQDIYFVNGRFDMHVENPALWWPLGYGKANVYDMKVELLVNGTAVAERHAPLGIRTVKLDRTEITDAHGGEFCFIVNGVKIFCKGSNWVPADAMHSRDASRYEKMLELWVDSGSNILRCWGGGVYEDHGFFNYCDRHGIMVWQDFIMACAVYPIDEEFIGVMREEAEVVVKRLRNHPSIILWSGDNECDQLMIGMTATDPALNRITREVLPQVVARMDPYRPYLASSPYIAPEVSKYGTDYYKISRLMPEDHLWGPRDYFKSSFYTNANAHFVSETGYHGCSSITSMRGFLSEDKLWPWQHNEEWYTHSADMFGETGKYAYRIKLMADQIHEMFGFDAETLEDFVLASQISQAEAKKFFVELTRAKKWRRTGVIWWNIIDGWPQFSDAVVGYDFIKKLAYYYIKRTQRPIGLVMGEIESWHSDLLACNDTLEDAKGTCRVWDGDTGEVVYAGDFEARANETRPIAKIRVSHGDHRLFLMEWTVNGERFVNHYVLGMPPFSFERYKGWLKKIAALDGSFDADTIWQ